VYWFRAPGKPFRWRSGIPVSTACCEPSLATSPLVASRASSGHAPESDAGVFNRRTVTAVTARRAGPHPPGLPPPTAHEEPRIRFVQSLATLTVALSREHGRCHARHLPTSAFRTLSPAYTPRPRPGLFHPGNAPGVSPTGLRTFPGSPNPSQGRVLSCRSPRPPRREARETRIGCRALIPPESSYRTGPKSVRGRCPPGVIPSKALPAPGVYQDL
jgi:hypothetical protein